MGIEDGAAAYRVVRTEVQTSVMDDKPIIGLRLWLAGPEDPTDSPGRPGPVCMLRPEMAEALTRGLLEAVQQLRG